MADDIRIKDLQSTASYMESDDYLGIDSLASGTRKINFAGLMDSEDGRLPTTDKTPRGAIAEHEGDISEIKQSLSDYIKIKTITVQKANLSTNMDLSSYVSLDRGYKFLAWQVDGTSNGWITQMPIYISTPSDVRGFPWWHPNLTISGAVNFYYFEIKDV
jgi:hypothetical protein